MTKKTLLRSLLLACLWLAGYGAIDSVVLAQGINQWTPRQRVPGVHDLADTPFLVADQNKTVHAFHTYPLNDDNSQWAIFYSRWTVDQGWTRPIDIFLSSGNLISVQGVFLDQNGILHLVYYCCDDANPNIFYSQAPAATADRAPAWSPPELIGEEAIPPATAGLIGDTHGNLFVLYGGALQTKGVYAIYSSDGGATWSEPVPISIIYEGDHFPYNLSLLLDRQERLHAVWVVNTADGNGFAVYYARLEADGASWSEPMALSMANGQDIGRTSGPAIAEYNGELIVVYTACEPCERRMRRSTDGGITWTNPLEPFQPSRGDYGAVTFATDSNQELHVIFGDRARFQTLWHTTWQGYWLQPRAVISLEEAEANRIEGDPMEFTPSKPVAVISQGNVLLTVWTTDPGHGNNGTWYAYSLLDAPELPVVALPTSTPIPTPTPTAMPTPIPSPTQPPLRTGAGGNAPAAALSNAAPMMLMLVGVTPVVLLVFITMLILTWSRNRSQFKRS